MSLLDDARSLAQNGEMPATEALDIARRFATDSDPRIVSASIALTRRIAVWASNRKTFAAFIRATYGSAARNAGWQPRPGDDDDVRVARRDLLTLVTDLGDDSELAAEAIPFARRWLSDPAAIDPDLRDTIAGIAVQAGGDALLRDAIDTIRKSADVSTRRTLYTAVASVRDPRAVSTVLALTLDPKLSIDESVWVIYTLGADSRARPAVLQFIRSNYDALSKRLPNDIFFPSVTYLPFVAVNACDPAARKWVEGLNASIGVLGGAKNHIQQVSETIAACEAARTLQSASVGTSVAQFSRSR